MADLGDAATAVAPAVGGRRDGRRRVATRWRGRWHACRHGRARRDASRGRATVRRWRTGCGCALDEGRLDLHEYDERLQRAYAARPTGSWTRCWPTCPAGAAAAVGAAPVAAAPCRTAGAARSAGPAVPARSGGRRVGGSRWPGPAWGRGSGVARRGVIAIWWPIWAGRRRSAGELLYFWPVWVLGPWGAVLLLRTVGGLAAGRAARDGARGQRRGAARRGRARAAGDRRRTGREIRASDAAAAGDHEALPADAERPWQATSGSTGGWRTRVRATSGGSRGGRFGDRAQARRTLV